MRFRSSFWFPRIIILVLFVIAGFLTGCDNTMNPIDREQGLYSIYGILDMTQQENYIRVKDLNTPFKADCTKKIDATVTLENLSSGNRETLEDTRTKFEEVYVHNFKATMNIDPETKYRLTAKRSDGKKVTATATTPAVVTSSASPQDETCFMTITLTFSPIDVQHLDVELGIEYRERVLWLEADRLGPFFTNSQGDVTTITFSPKGLLNELFAPQGNRESICCYELSSEVVRVRYTVYGPDFFADNISNEFDLPGEKGSFGALDKDSYAFTIDTTRVCPTQP